MKQKTRSVGVAMQEQSQAESSLDYHFYIYLFDEFMLRYRNRLASGFSECVMTAPTLWDIHLSHFYIKHFVL